MQAHVDFQIDAQDLVFLDRQLLVLLQALRRVHQPLNARQLGGRERVQQLGGGGGRQRLAQEKLARRARLQQLGGLGGVEGHHAFAAPGAGQLVHQCQAGQGLEHAAQRHTLALAMPGDSREIGAQPALVDH